MPGTLVGMYHPWRAFGQHEDWLLARAELPDGLRGVADFDTRTVILHSRLRQVERRCTLAHEIVHIERGPVPVDERLAAREESAVQREAARRLISLEALGEALAWSEQPAEVADVLWVTEDVLQARLASLHPAERAWLHERLSDCRD